MKKTFELLATLTVAIDPDKGRRHSISFSEEANLILTVSAHGGFYKFDILHDDFDKSVEELVEEVLALFHQAIKEQTTLNAV